MRTTLRRCALGVGALIAAALAGGSAVAQPGQSTPSAAPSPGRPFVGVIFAPHADQQSCTATVINSHTGDLVLTAAHCVSGSGAGWTFAPDWHSGKTPEGRWTVTAAYALPGWLQDQDPQQDMAMLKVAPQTIDGHPRTLQSVTGAADVGLAPASGQVVTDVAYNNDADEPIDCTTTVYWTEGHPSFDCHGYVGGSSGSPWLVASAGLPKVVGMIGGLNQGGCVESTSYSSAFGANIVSLWLHAEGALQDDVLPAPDPDGC